MMIDRILQGEALSAIRMLPSESVHCCVTSPPYFGLRDYGVAGQIGLEKTVEAYVEKLVEVFREVRRVLRSDGTLWLNLGDSYAGSGRGNPKNLLGVPWRVAFALQADGWYLRSDIIWHKPNPMPEPVLDRPTRSHEYIFLLSKSAKYFYDADAIKTEAKTNEGRPPGVSRNRLYNYDSKENRNPEAYLRPGKQRARPLAEGAHAGYVPGEKRIDKQRWHSRRHASSNDRWNQMSREEQQSKRANKRDVWTVATKPFKGAHFATFPPDLIKPCILAGSPDGGMVLDPFFGAGTTGVVSKACGRHYLGIEINPEYIKVAKERIASFERTVTDQTKLF